MYVVEIHISILHTDTYTKEEKQGMRTLRIWAPSCDIEERKGYISGCREFRLFVRPDVYGDLEKAANMISVDVDKLLTRMLRNDIEEAAQDLQDLRER